MPYFLAFWIVISAHAKALTLESEHTLGKGKLDLTILANGDFNVVEPSLEEFVKINSDVQVRYWQASSQDIGNAVENGLPDEIDLVISSATDLQIKAANDGKSQRIEGLDGQNWRGHLYTLALEPIVSLYDRNQAPALQGITRRSQLVAQLRRGDLALPNGVVLYDPRQSGLGYLLATQDQEQSDTFWPLIEWFAASGIRQYCCSSLMVESVLSGESTIAHNILLSYAERFLQEHPHLRVLAFEDYQLAVPRTGFIPAKADGPDPAREYMRFLLSQAGQETLPSTVRLAQLEPIKNDAPLMAVRLTPALIVHLDKFTRNRFYRQWSSVTSVN